MMSSCHGCAQTFGFLKREYGCPNCKFSYCKNCLRFKISDSKTKKDIVVCYRCFTVATSKMDPEEPPIITKALQKLESMENPARPPITVYKQHARSARLAQLKKGLSVEDQHIAERLESLRKTDEPSDINKSSRRRSEQMEEEIAERLARLKDEEPRAEGQDKSYSSLYKSKPETETDLISRYTEEVQLDKQYQTGVVSDIQLRLAKLRGDGSQSQPSGSGSTSVPNRKLGDFEEEDISEEEQVRRIMERFKAEADLETKTSESSNITTGQMDRDDSSTETAEPQRDINMSSDSGGDDDEDLDNLCRICDEKRATLKCKECDDDLFCKKCFQELHDELGEVHKATQLKK